MTDFSGRKIKYGLALESTRNVAVAPTLWLRWETADFYDHATTILNQSALGVLDKYSGAETVNTMGQGQLAGKITDRSFGLLLFAAFGSYSKVTHSGESVVYDHTFTESQANAATTLTITRVDPNVTNQFAECMLNSLEIDVKAGDFIRHISQFTSQPSNTASANPVFVSENEFIAKNCSVKFADSVASFPGATAVPLASLKLTVSKNVNPYWIIGQNNPSDIFAQAVEIKGEMILRYTDQTYYNYRFNNTLRAVQVNIVNTGVTIGSATNPTITFTMPACYLNDWKADQSIDGIVQQTVQFEGTFSLAQGYAISALMSNTVNNYNTAVIS